VFRKVLIANRGEIAVRLIRGCREMGLRTVAVYSDVDRASLAVQLADEAAHLGPAPSSESYLNIAKILDAARHHGADAIHPGYGFLSENAAFAQACDQAGIVFIGPSAHSIHVMGSKTEARALASSAGTPIVPGTSAGVDSFEAASKTAAKIGYPIIVKAAAGGGGKGMRRVDSPSQLESALRDASSEAERAFRSGEVYIEKFIEQPRHIEIQVFGDKHGNLIHLGERECSIQRRHQKVVEECPSPFVSRFPGLRQRMGEAAVKAAKAAGYYNAGTVEFLVDHEGNFYFLEMNTRLQVEHPVTELVTGYDLVHWQLRIAAGERLPIHQDEVTWRGSAIECRLYAEDSRDFLPSPGRIDSLAMPQGPGVRVDSGVYEGWTVPVDYDPLLAKLAVWAPDRHLAIARLRQALAETHVGGIQNNIPFFRDLVDDPQFQQGQLHTGFIPEFFARRREKQPSPDALAALAVVAASQKQAATPISTSRSSDSAWKQRRYPA
jgi:acetyl-CoA carboxylase, biotin carboxylase subunit